MRGLEWSSGGLFYPEEIQGRSQWLTERGLRHDGGHPGVLAMSRSRLRPILFTLLASTLVCGSNVPSADSQQAVTLSQQPGREPVPTIEAHANLVQVDVVVSRHGRDIRGLLKDQFKIVDNGRLQTVSVFEEHRPEEPEKVASAPVLGPHVYSNLPQYRVKGAVNVLLLDALNTPLENQMYVRQQMVAYLRQLPPGSHIAVFTLSSRLRMISDLTVDTDMLVRAVSRVDVVQHSLVTDPRSDDAVEQQEQSMQAEGFPAESVNTLRQFQADLASYRTDLRLGMTLDAFDQLARYLRVIPGRKNLIWFSGSFPLQILADDTLIEPLVIAREYGERLRQADIELAAARVSVYPIDARGALTLPSADASKSEANPVLPRMSFNPGATIGTPIGGGTGTTSGPTVIGLPVGSQALPGTYGEPKVLIDDAHFVQQAVQERNSMQQIAEDTGGQAFTGRNDFGQEVKEAMLHGSEYYTIGFVPQLKPGDTTYHRLTVKVQGGGTLGYRRGYYAGSILVSSPVKHDRMAAALLDGAPPLSDLLFRVRVVPQQPAPGASVGRPASPRHAQMQTLSFDYNLPVAQLAFASTADGLHQGRVAFIVVAYDEDGRAVGAHDQAVGFHLPQAAYSEAGEKGLSFHQELAVPQNAANLRIVVQNLDGGAIGATEIPLESVTSGS